MPELKTGVVDGVVGVEVLKLLAGRADEHVAHEKRVIGAGANGLHLDPVRLSNCRGFENHESLPRAVLLYF